MFLCILSVLLSLCCPHQEIRWYDTTQYGLDVAWLLCSGVTTDLLALSVLYFPSSAIHCIFSKSIFWPFSPLLILFSDHDPTRFFLSLVFYVAAFLIFFF